MNSIYIPDAVFGVIFLTLYWRYLQVNYESHIKLGEIDNFSTDSVSLLENTSN
jgi:hypothetical protein